MCIVECCMMLHESLGPNYPALKSNEKDLGIEPRKKKIPSFLKVVKADPPGPGSCHASIGTDPQRVLHLRPALVICHSQTQTERPGRSVHAKNHAGLGEILRHELVEQQELLMASPPLIGGLCAEPSHREFSWTCLG